MPVRVSDVRFVEDKPEFSYEPLSVGRDFGPLDVSATVVYCRWVDALCQAHSNCRALVHITDDGPREAWSNSVTLCCAYSILARGLSARDAFQPFAYLDLPPFLDCRGEGSNGIELQGEESDFRLGVLDVLMGIQRARDLGWLDYRSFQADVHTQMLRTEHGDMSWILHGHALAMASPWARPVDTEGMPVCTPEVLVPFFLENKISLIIQCNHPQSEEKGDRRELISYDPRLFESAGIAHAWLPFEDGGCPAVDIILKFLDVVESRNGAFVVHCRSGLGRTATLIGIYAMRHFGFTARSFIGWSRVVRPGTVHGGQQQYLVNLEPYLRPGIARPLSCLSETEQLQMLPMRELSFWALDLGIRPELLANRTQAELIEIILEARTSRVQASGSNLRAPDPAANRSAEGPVVSPGPTVPSQVALTAVEPKGFEQVTPREKATTLPGNPDTDPWQEAFRYVNLLGALQGDASWDVIVQSMQQLRQSPSNGSTTKSLDESVSPDLQEVEAAHSAALAEIRQKETELKDALQLARDVQRECEELNLSIAIQQDALREASSEAMRESTKMADLQRQLAEAAEARRQKLEVHRKEQAALQAVKDHWKALQAHVEAETASQASSEGPMEAWKNAKASLDRLRMRLEQN